MSKSVIVQPIYNKVQTNPSTIKVNIFTFAGPSSSGGGGATAFTDLTDVPGSYTGEALKLLRVNNAETGIEFFTPSYITGNQTITLSNDVSGSGATAISVTIGANKVTYAKLQQIAALSLIGNPTSSLANAQAIGLGAGLSFNSGNLINSGVTSIVAGTDIGISGATGAVTINNSSTLATVTGRGNSTSTGVILNQQGPLSTDYALYLKRNNDFTPLGYYIQAQNAAANADIFTVDASGNVISLSYAVPGGTSSQFLKADGSLDSNTYLTAGSSSNQLKSTVRAKTTTALSTNTYNNGVAGVGATLTANSDGLVDVIDGVTLVVNDIILVSEESASENNGVYVVTDIGSVSSPYILTRYQQMDEDSEFVGSLIPVSDEGVVHGNTLWIVNTVGGSFTVGTSAVIVELIPRLLPVVNGGTGFSSYTIGDMLYSSSTTVLSKLAIGTTNQVLTVIGGIPTWQTPISGFTNPMTTLGDIIYEDATPTAVRLAGNTTSTKKFLSQTGTGVISAAPDWSALVSGDIPNNAANTTGSAATLTTGRTISITGDLSYTSPAFDGSTNITAAGTLATVNSNTGSFGSATQVGTFTVNGKGLITAASNVTITPAASSITGAAALTKTDDTNVTLTLGGSPTIALLAAASLTLGWSGTLAYARFVNGTGLSVVGRSTNSSGVQADITGTTDQVLRVNGAGTTLGFGSIDLSKSATIGSSVLPVANGGTNISSYTIGDLIYASGSTTLSKLADVATGSVLTSGGVGVAPAWSALSGIAVTSISGTANQITASASTGAVTLSLPSSVIFPGTWAIGTLGYSDTGILWSAQSSTNSYNQVIVQNTNSGASASANFIVSNDSGTSSTKYGEFGINSSGFTGSGSFNTANAVYLDAVSDDLVIGTIANKTLHFVTNNSTTDNLSITGAGVFTFTVPVNGSIFTSTWTATANTQNAFDWTGTITARGTASDTLRYLVIDPTLVSAAATQTLTAFLLNPTFTDANSATKYIFRAQNASSDRFNVQFDGATTITSGNSSTSPTLKLVGIGTGTNYVIRSFQSDGTTENFSLKDNGLWAFTSTVPSSTISNTWTATGNNQAALTFSGTITSENTNSDNINYLAISPTIAKNAGNPTSQILNTVLIASSFSNVSASVNNNALKITQAGNTMLTIGALNGNTPNVSIGSEAAANATLFVKSIAAVATLLVRGQGTTSNTLFQLQNSTPATIMLITDGGKTSITQRATSTSGAFFTLTQFAETSASVNAVNFAYGAHTGQSAEVQDFVISARTLTFSGSQGAIASLQRSNVFNATTYAASGTGTSIGTAVNVYISGAPIISAGANSFSATATAGIYIDASNVTSAVTTSYGLYVNAQTNGGTNYSASFAGGSGIQLQDINLVLGTTTGTKIGTGTTQKLGFFNATPVVQEAGTNDVLASLVTLGLRAASSNPPLNLGTGALTCGTIAMQDNMTVTDAKNFIINTSTGTKFGTGTTQKIGFWNATPVVQPASTGTTTSGFTANASANTVYAESTFTGNTGSTAYTISDVVKNLKNAGILAA